MNTLINRAAIAFAVLAIAVAVVHTGGGPSVVLKVDGHANANVSVAARDRFVSVVWAAVAEGGSTDIYAAMRRDAGATFGSPLRVNDLPGDAHVSGEQPPRIVLVPRANGDPSVVVVWTSSRKDGTRLLTAHSDDGARTFSRAALVPGGEASGNRGWESAIVDAAGHVDVMWLDHRDMTHAATSARQASGASDHTPHDGVAMAQQSQLFVSSLDSAVSPHAVTRGVCYCCKTAMASGPDDSLYVAWRHVYPGNVRDIAFSMSQDGGRTFAVPIRVSDDRWVLDGCPENGPALAVDSNRRIHIVWPTLLPAPAPDSEATLGLFYAMSDDGRQFTRRQRIPTEGVPRHPQMAIDGRGHVFAAWDEQLNGTRHVALGRTTVDGSGNIRMQRVSVKDDMPGVYPALAGLPQGAVAAWVGGSSGAFVIRVERLFN